MKNGYYLSTYMYIDELAHLEKILNVRHDQNISLWYKHPDNTIELVHYWELERVTGVKHCNLAFYDEDHAVTIINQLLSRYNLTLKDMIEVWGTLRLQTEDDYHSMQDYPDFAYHGIAHLFSAILCNSDLFYSDNIIGMSVDGGPDAVQQKVENLFSYPGCLVEEGKVVDMFSTYSPGPLWHIASTYYGLKEGTLMALVSASESKLYDVNDEPVLVDNLKSLHKMNEYLIELVNKVEKLSKKDEGVLFSGFDLRFSIEDNKISMVMKEIQKMSVAIMVKNIEDIVDRYKIDTTKYHLALSGGYVLNCPTNSYLMQKYKFKSFIAPPCVNDGGMSLGVALYSFYKKLKKIKFNLSHAYYGDKVENFESIINNREYSIFIKDVSEYNASKAVEDIKSAPIVWFDGAAEIGPRALGGRSIFADPRNENSKDQLNIIKQRQWWRPVAPIILEEELDKWFEEAYPSSFMLHTFKIKKDKVSLIPSIAHLDLSSRVQSINQVVNCRLYDFIKSFMKDTGVPIICNTSLNDRGEPIINRIDEALNFSLRKGINIMYINGMRVELQNHNQHTETEPSSRLIEMNKSFSDDERASLIKKFNPYDIPRDVLDSYYFDIMRFADFNITNINDVKKLKRVLKLINHQIVIK